MFLAHIGHSALHTLVGSIWISLTLSSILVPTHGGYFFYNYNTISKYVNQVGLARSVDFIDVLVEESESLA